MQDKDETPPAAEAVSGASAALPRPGGSTRIQRRGRDRRRRRRRILAWTAGGLVTVLLAAGGFGWWLYDHLNGNIRTQDFADQLTDRPPPTGGMNVLLVGSDSRAGDNAEYGRDEGGTQRSDTTILLHVPEGRKAAIAVSFPRDLMVDVPACRTTVGGTQRAYFGQFNSAMEVGGVPCVAATVERLTGARIDHQITIDFTGFKKVVDALGGVPMHIDQPIDDKAARLRLPAGDVNLNGEQALGFVRVRKSMGDGSDIQRIARQQEFLRALVKKVQDENLLTNPARAYNVMDAATKAITTDSGINSLVSLYDFANGLRSIPLDRIEFTTTPLTDYAPDPNRVALSQPDAGRLFTRLRDGAPAPGSAATVTVTPKSAAR
ncbi:LCP family protein [Embleya scabrispora]|uniref:LCP family protein n=1 Tax=Embleya scabrispora TaxID=159449 RepID=UPI000367296A|nr:LCP family protein [Embleya scabrispora]MYS82414.1 LytR family transcriptional regulator [Streptomyces sp. SID5474]